jgi:hypothetical protein
MINRNVVVYLVVGLTGMLVGNSFPSTNIDPGSTGSARYGWSENSGWTNLYGNGTDGVVVTPDYLHGSAWLENAGWLSFGDTAPLGPGNHYTNTAPDNLTQPNYGVNNDRSGRLWGYAWGENTGWVNFGTGPGSPLVTVDSATGRFSGSAWSEALGWISFTGVAIADVATVPAGAVPAALSYFVAE